MEVCVAHVDHVPEGYMLALTAGSSRRLAPLAARQKFAFAGPAATAAAAEGGAGIKLEVLMIQGSTRVDASKLTAGVLGCSDGAPNAQRLEVPLKLLDGVMKVGLTVRPVAQDGGRHGRGREAQRFARMTSPDSEKKLKKSGMIPMDGLGLSGDESSPTTRRGRHSVALEARTYLEEHKILSFVEEMMRILVKERPQDPWGRISKLFPAEAQLLLQAPETLPPPTDAYVKADQTLELPGVQSKDAKDTSDFGTASSAFASHTAIEFVIDNLSYKDITENAVLCRSVVEKVQGAIATKLGLKASSVEVELGHGSLIVGAMLKAPTPEQAEAIRSKVQADSKGVLASVETSLLELKALESMVKGGQTQGLGLRSLRAVVRTKLVEDARTTASTFAPATAATLFFAGETHDSWISGGEAADGSPDETMLNPLNAGSLSPSRPRELSEEEKAAAAAALARYRSRKRARAILLGASKDGKLHDILDAMWAQRRANAIAQTKETLMTCLRNGRLSQSFQEVEEYREEQRQKARQKILQGLEDGSLEDALQTVMGKPSLDDEQDEAPSEAPVQGVPMLPEKVREKVKAALLSAGLKRTLAPTITAWLGEKDGLIRNPRPVPLEPVGEYVTEHLKWDMEGHLKGLYASFVTARKAAQKREEPPPALPSKVAPPLPSQEKATVQEKAVTAPKLPPSMSSDSPLDQFSHVIAAHFSHINKPGRRKPKATPEAAPLPKMPKHAETRPSTTDERPYSAADSSNTAEGIATVEAQKLLEAASWNFKLSSPACSGFMGSEVSQKGIDALAAAEAVPAQPPALSQDDDDEDADLAATDDDKAALEVAEEGLSVDLSFKNMDYESLKANSDLWDAFIWETKKTIAAQAGEGVLPEHVVLDLEPGSVIVKAKIACPVKTDMQAATNGLANVAIALAENVKANIPTITSVATGDLEVSEPIVAKVSAAPFRKTARLQVKNTIKKRLKVEQESAQVVDDELRKLEEERQRKAAEDAERQRKFESEVEEELRKTREQHEEAERRRKVEEEKLLEEELKRKEEEDAAKRQAAERKAAEEMQAAQEAAKRQAAADAAAATAKEEEAAAKAKEDEEAAATAKAQEEKEAAAQLASSENLDTHFESRLKAEQEKEQHKKDEEMKQVAATLQQYVPKQGMVPHQGSSGDDSAEAASSDETVEEICNEDRVEVINSLYLGQEGMEVLAGWQGSVLEINDGDAVIHFYGMDEGRYVLREDFSNLIVMKADSSISSSSADVLAVACSEAVNQNETLRAQNAALRIELDRLLALATPMSTPPLTGASIPRQDFHTMVMGTPTMTPPYTASVPVSQRQPQEFTTPPLSSASRPMESPPSAITPPLPSLSVVTPAPDQ